MQRPAPAGRTRQRLQALVIVPIMLRQAVSIVERVDAKRTALRQLLNEVCAPSQRLSRTIALAHEHAAAA